MTDEEAKNKKDGGMRMAGRGGREGEAEVEQETNGRKTGEASRRF